MIQSELDAGRLVRLYDYAIKSKVAYYFVCPPNAIERFKIKAFCDWLLSESPET
jgi:LysR family glycine cleavage system transcriptional activator